MSVFKSFFQAGFECSTHRRHDSRRLDLTASTYHDIHALADYQILADLDIRTVRDGLRWHLIEPTPGRYDWSSFLPLLRAAQASGTQVIWDLCHYGWPDDLEIWSPAFVERFAAFAQAAAQLIHDESDAIPLYVPVNEISFFAWAGADKGYINPFATGRGVELKLQLARAAIAGIEAVWSIDRRARIVQTEPVINIVPASADPAEIGAVRDYTLAQYQSWDLLCGRLRPDLGGRPEYLDIVGVNYYWNNQWVHHGEPIAPGHPHYRPFATMLGDVYERYGRPLIVAETSIEGQPRHTWLRSIGAEVRAAQAAGIPVEGICWYPVVSHLGWDNDRYCANGLLDFHPATGERLLYDSLAAELRQQQELFASERLRETQAG